MGSFSNFVVLALLCFSAKVFANPPPSPPVVCNYPPPCVCPETTVKNPEQLASDRSILVVNLLNTTNTSWSPLVTKFKSQIQKLYLCESSTPEQKRFAEFAIVFLNNVNRNLDPKKCLNSCTYASIFGALLDYYNDCCNQKILKLFDDCIIRAYFGSMIDLAVASAYNNLPCPGAAGKSLISLPATKCNKNGYCYDFDGIWDLQGGYLPCHIRETVLKMYDSKDCRHKYLAALFTFSMLDMVNKFSDLTFDFGAWTESNLYSVGERIPECCCTERIAKLDYLSYRIQNHMSLSLSELRAKYVELPPCCKK